MATGQFSIKKKERGEGKPNGVVEDDGPFTIGDMARDFQVTLRTLRFYENRGLLHPRREAGARLYSASDRKQLKTILEGRQLGFTLTEIRDMLRVPTAPNGGGELGLGLTPPKIRAQIDHLERQRSGIDAALSQLRAAHKRLASGLS